MRFILIGLILGLGVNAFAALGEHFDTNNKGQSRRPYCTSSIQHYSRFDVHVCTGKIAVREYIAPNGVVFGVAWRGIAHPPLRQLLGSYETEYHAERRRHAKIGRHGLHTLTTQNIVIQRSGHMSDVGGRAYVPSLIPAGVTESDIEGIKK